MDRSIQWLDSVPAGATEGEGSAGLPRYRSLPDPLVAPKDIAQHGWTLADLLLPTMTLRASAAEHNAALHAAWCKSVGVSQAPHAKTHLSPELVRLQLDSGAWGMTAATVHQARFLAAAGSPRVLIAHQVVDAANVRALVRLRAEHPDLVVMTLVDSVAGVELLHRHLKDAGADRPLPVLLEVGVPEGRTGVRDDETAVAVATAVRDSDLLTLAGVEGFEGVLPSGRTAEQIEPVDAYLARIPATAARLDELGLFSDVEEIVLTAGGSVYPDRVAAMDRPELSRPVRVVVRSGATVTHDHGQGAANAPLAPEAEHPMGALRPALELWAAVVSTPEPGLALAAFGKRDAPYDSRLPVVLEVRRDGKPVPGATATVRALNDQHGYLDHDGALQVGDVVRFGVVHPCTAFDKWPLIPVLADDDTVIGAVTTWF